MSGGIADIDVAGAAEAIDNAGGIDTLIAEQTTGPQTSQTPAPREVADQTYGATNERNWARDEAGRFAPREQQPVSEQPALQPTPQQDTFTRADLNSLLAGVTDPNARQAIETAYKSFQGDYTRKTQELAERARVYEQFGDPGTLQEAVELYQSLQDPNNWMALHQELSVGLEQLGLTPQQAEAVASQEVQRQQMANDPLAALQADPELAPVAQELTGLRQELEQLKSYHSQREQAAQAEQLQMALVGELQRQDAMIRQSNPHYTDSDMDAVYELASFYEGNLLQAQKRYDEIFNERMNRYFDKKQGAVGSAGIQSMPGGGTLTTQPQEFGDLDTAHDAAMEHLRMLELAD